MKKSKAFHLNNIFKHLMPLLMLALLSACGGGGGDGGEDDSATSLPDTSISSGPDSLTNSTNASFVFISTEAESSFQCSLDSGTFVGCSSPKTYDDLTEANYTFEVRATDVDGNTDATPAVHNWEVDVTAPNTSISTGLSNPTNSTSATFVFIATETGSSFECSIDGGAYADCVSPKTYNGLAEGDRTFLVRAADMAGNTDATPAEYNWKIDITPPDTSITNGPASPTKSANAGFEFTSTETESTFQCSIDGGAYADCISPKAYASLLEGDHRFSVRATDAAGNPDESPAVYDWTIDTTPPVVTVPVGITVIAPGGVPATDTDIQAFLSGATATDNVDGNVSSGISGDAPTTFPLGITTVTFSVTDTAGNTGSETSTVEVIDVDNVAPDTTSIVINSNAQYAVVVDEFSARLSALDNVGVTAYLITEHNATDPANIVPPYLDPKIPDAGWVPVTETVSLNTTIQFPLMQTYSLGDTVELCVWFKDEQGNISGRVCDSIVLGNDWESAWGNWFADNGVWGIGTPAAGPAGCFSGTQCAGTELDGNYGGSTDSRLISATMTLPAVSGFEEVHLRFQNWFSYSSYDSGQVQIQVWDAVALSWGAWTDEGAVVVNTSGWSLKDVDLTAYAGETVRLAFYHIAQPSWESTGWYIDDIQIVTKVPEFTGTFEAGWDDWSADRGVWGIGTPTAGPASCFSGTQCAGTELDGNYGGSTDSRLISATMTLPAVSGFEEVHLRFQNWFSYSSYDSGQVQIQVWDAVALSWGAWTDEGAVVVNTSGWSLKDVDLTAYAGETVRLAFYHIAQPSWESTGWYIDDVSINKF